MLIQYTKAAVFARYVDRKVEQNGCTRLQAIMNQMGEDVEEVDNIDLVDLDIRETILIKHMGVFVLKFPDHSGFLWSTDMSGDDVEDGFYGIVPYVDGSQDFERACTLCDLGDLAMIWIGKHQPGERGY